MNKLIATIITFLIILSVVKSLSDSKLCDAAVVSSSHSSCNDISGILTTKTNACCWVERKPDGKDKKIHHCLVLAFDLDVIKKKVEDYEKDDTNTDVSIYCSTNHISTSLTLLLTFLFLIFLY